MENKLDRDVKKYLKTLRFENEIWFNGLYTLWPRPTSTQLWFAGLKKYGREFSEREFELRHEKQEK